MHHIIYSVSLSLYIYTYYYLHKYHKYTWAIFATSGLNIPGLETTLVECTNGPPLQPARGERACGFMGSGTSQKT